MHELVRTFAIPVMRTVVATAVIGLAAVVAAGAYVRWRAVDTAIRDDRSLPDSNLMVLLAGVITMICLLVGVAVAVA